MVGSGFVPFYSYPNVGLPKCWVGQNVGLAQMSDNKIGWTNLLSVTLTHSSTVEG